MNKNLKIAVLGAGMSGMAMGHSLIKAGFTNFTIYEKADRVGGTWRENNYPGVLAMCRRIFIHFRLSAIRIGARRFRRAARFSNIAKQRRKSTGSCPIARLTAP